MRTNLEIVERVRNGAWMLAFWLVIGGTAMAGIPEPDLVWYGRIQSTVGGVPVRVTTGNLVWKIEPKDGSASWTLTTTLTNVNDQFSYVLRVPCESPEPGVGAGTGVVVLTSPVRSYGRVTVTLNGQPIALSGNAATQFSPGLNSRGQLERIDLQLGTGPVDSDGNGLADDWELLHYGRIGTDPNADTDGDGMTSLQEFRAGTNPKDGQSRFAFIEIQPATGGVQMRWASQADRKYRVLRSTTLDGAGTFVVIRTGLVATPPVNVFTDSLVVTSGQHFFYRIELED